MKWIIMETVKLTELELTALKTITQSDFYEHGRGSVVWDFSVFDICSIPKRSRSGVFSSLVQKDLIVISEKNKKFFLDENGRKCINPYYDSNDYGTIYITELGYKVLDELDLLTEYGTFKK